MGSQIDSEPLSLDPQGSPVLDREQIDGLIAAAGVNGAKDILDAFWRCSDNLFRELQVHLSSGDLIEASKTAHGLKGSAMNVGAIGLSCSVRAIEDACRTEDGAAALKRLASAESQYSETAEAFAALFASAA